MISLLSHARKLWLSCDFCVFFFFLSAEVFTACGLARPSLSVGNLHLLRLLAISISSSSFLCSLYFFGEGMSRPPWFLCWLSCIIADYIVFRGRGIGKSVFAAYLGVVSRSLILISYFLRLSLLSPQSRRMLRAIRMLACFHSILFSV